MFSRYKIEIQIAICSALVTMIFSYKILINDNNENCCVTRYIYVKLIHMAMLFRNVF